MSLSENFFAVLLHGERIGTLCQRGDHTRFLLNEEYIMDPERDVLGLRFEESLRKPYSSALRLPPWFSNLLPEGPLRQWIATDRGVSLDREMELLAQVGHDLPGAVQVLPTDGPDVEPDWSDRATPRTPRVTSAAGVSPWRFSLAGVALKFSMLAQGDRLTVPAADDRGDWLVKFPDYRYSEVPRNEFVMMSFAKAAGLDVPEVLLVHRDELEGLPGRMWPNSEEWAFAVKRFDRSNADRRVSVHIEDLAQVRDFYPEAKYQSSYETVGALVYRGFDTESLIEFVRRLAFYVLVGNGDGHLKNWSLRYANRRVPKLSPAYDIVSTQAYRDSLDGPEDLGLRFGLGKRFEDVNLETFAVFKGRLERRLGEVSADLPGVAEECVERALEVWPAYRALLEENPPLLNSIDSWITSRASAFR
ncbi:type II toxin-antitoxin system HipA family toxin [Micromonospora robiginosa]|uniref:Type II toxin-antitoxin system HipA family toxin n=1 Tax=Micromonospora robiginosa TaxID=2749844 RepID=A0A7L6B6C2_9ACTN|nr:type II toxin-antitoxin system HipA family toxin [Micromonospora ferruginea]QLQ37492.1 type II toxin-antitoxin system HipA family toxin [Micromonospora ferruginea]